MEASEQCICWGNSKKSAINVHIILWTDFYLDFGWKGCLCRWNWSGIADKCHGREDIAAWVIIGVQSLHISFMPSLSIYKRRVYIYYIIYIYRSDNVERLWSRCLGHLQKLSESIVDSSVTLRSTSTRLSDTYTIWRCKCECHISVASLLTGYAR